jgi:hypothetical protein
MQVKNSLSPAIFAPARRPFRFARRRAAHRIDKPGAEAQGCGGGRGATKPSIVRPGRKGGEYVSCHRIHLRSGVEQGARPLFLWWSDPMLLNLLAQTWRSVVSVIIAWALVILSLIYYPEALAAVIESARGTRQFLLDLVGTRGNDTVDILAGAIITDHTVTMAFMFLFARIVVLTTILYIIASIYVAVTGRQPGFMRH